MQRRNAEVTEATRREKIKHAETAKVTQHQKISEPEAGGTHKKVFILVFFKPLIRIKYGMCTIKEYAMFHEKHAEQLPQRGFLI